MSSLAVLDQVAHGPQNEVNPRIAPTESDVATLVRELFVRAREARRGLMQQWKRNYRALNNRDYRLGDNAWDEQPAISNIWPTIASATAWMTDQRPELEVTPTSEQFSPYHDWYDRLANDMNTLLMASFRVHALDAEITKVLWDVHTYGVGWYKTAWEPWLGEGLGDAAFRRKDPFTIYPDPHAKSPEDMSYIIELHQMTVADCDRTWPGAARKIAQSYYLEAGDEAPHKLDESVRPDQPRVALGALSPSPVPQQHVNTGQSVPRPTESPIVTVIECYVRGYTTEPGETEGTTLVRDDWRVIVVTGNAVLMDEKVIDVNAFDTHPYDRQVLFDNGEMYGACIVEFLTPIQRLVNWLLGAMARNIYLMGNPVFAEPLRNASRNKRFSNRPGQRVEGDPQSVGWLNPPQMHPQLSTDLIAYLEGKIETISGLSAMVRGFAPTGRNAQGVLDSVQDAAFVRVRASLRELERSLRGVGSKMAATIAEFYTEPRMMSVAGPDGQKTHMSLRARHFYTIETDDPGKRIPLRFSLVADTGSQLATSKQARAGQAQDMFKLGLIDELEALKAMDWPNHSLVAQRVMEQKAMAAQAEGSKKK